MDNEENNPIQEEKSKLKSKGLKYLIPLLLFIGGLILIRRQPFVALAVLGNMVPWVFIGGFVVGYIILLANSDVVGKNERLYNPERGNKHLKTLGVYILVFIVLMVVSIISVFLPFSAKGRGEFVKVNGAEIPTLEKYTQYNGEILMDTINSGVENGVKLKVVTIIYKNDIPTAFLKDFTDGLKGDGYAEVTKGEGTMFVKNNENDGFSYVYITGSNKEIEYGASKSGTYDLILDRQKH